MAKLDNTHLKAVVKYWQYKNIIAYKTEKICIIEIIAQAILHIGSKKTIHNPQTISITVAC